MKRLWRLVLLGTLGGCVAAEGSSGDAEAAPGDTTAAPVVVKLLDVGQGDATLIENGGSRVLIDGGPEESRFGALLDSLRTAEP